MDFDLLEHLLERIWLGRLPLGALGLARSRLLSLERLELLTQRRTPRRIDHWIRDLRAAERCGELPDWHEMDWYDGFEAFSSVRRERQQLERRKDWADIITVPVLPVIFILPLSKAYANLTTTCPLNQEFRSSSLCQESLSGFATWWQRGDGLVCGRPRGHKVRAFTPFLFANPLD